jgi:hypothetical protein
MRLLIASAPGLDVVLVVGASVDVTLKSELLGVLDVALDAVLDVLLDVALPPP